MEKKVRRVALDSDETRTDLKSFHDFLRLRYGPFGKCALFPSPVGGGGVVCLTSRSEKLFQMLKLRSPVPKLVVSSSLAHTANYKESGLYTALLAIKLIRSGLDVERSQYKVAMVTSHTLSLVAEWLYSDTCPCKIPLSLTTSQELMCLTSTHLSSKSRKLGLTARQVDHLSSLILQAFLTVLPATRVHHYSFPARVHVSSCVGHPLEGSRLLHGVAIVMTDTEFLAQMEGGWNSIKRSNEGDILTAVFNVSLAGDFEEALSSEWSILAPQPLGVTVEGLVLEKLLSLAAGLVSSGVGMVGCQKCVHPLMREFLKEKGVLVVERLSGAHVESVREATGGQMNSQTDLHSLCLGRLKNISLSTVGKERYLVMESLDHVVFPHCTLAVCTPTETMADELLPLCNSSVSLLAQSLSSPYSLPGGGCTDTLISHMLTEKAMGTVETEILEELECDQGTYCKVLKSVARCFSSMAAALEHNGGQVLTDSSHHHCWSFPPYNYCTSLSSQQSSSHTPRLCREQSGSCTVEQNGKQFVESRLKWRCCCGALSLNNLPPGTRLTDAVTMDSASVPDEIHQLMEELVTHQTSAGTKKNGTVRLLDFGQARVKAIEMAGDIAANVLQVAFTLSE